MNEEQTWTIGRLLDWTARYLAEKRVEFPRLDAEVLLAHALGCKRIDLYGLRHGEVADADTRQKYRELIRKRLEGCPVAFLVGRKEFYSLDFEVTPAVLIPRPDSELVVMTCLDLAKSMPQVRAVDIGTGSGNLAVAVATHHAGAHVTAVDRSAEAVAVARRNAERHGVAERLTFVVGDLFSALPHDAQFDFVLSNPPYIPSGAIAQLPPGVRDYEPRAALDGGPDGFAVFEELVRQGKRHLAPGGYLIVEIGAPQEQGARQRLDRQGGFELAPTIRDFSGHPRVLKARRIA